MVNRKQRVAVLGGDGRFDHGSVPGARVRVFQSSRYGGNGPARRLERSIRSGGVDMVIVLARWNGHSQVNHLRRLCRQLGVPVEVRG